MSSVGYLSIVAVCLSACGHSGADSNPASDKATSDKATADKGKSASSEEKDSVSIDGPSQRRSGIRVAVIEPREVSQTLTAAGQITVNQDRTVHVGTYTDGRITELLATVGDFVKNGQVLARLHSHSLHETRASYEMAIQDKHLKESALAYAERQASRMRNLYFVKSTSQQEVERVEAEVVNAKTNLANADINLRKEREHLADILRIEPDAVPNALSEQNDVVPILSSISGIVTDRKVTPGSVIQPGDETFTVSDLSQVWMLASVNETDIATLKIGRHAQVLVQAFPGRPFPGIVTRLGTELDPQTRTLQARVVILNPRMQLRPEMFANARIEEGPSAKAIFVPEQAVQDINASPIVFVRGENNKFTAHPVQIAHTLNGEAEIQSGLKPGDHVVVQGAFVVKSEMLKSQIGQ